MVSSIVGSTIGRVVCHHVLHLIGSAIRAEGVTVSCHIHLRILTLVILLVLHMIRDALLAPNDAILIILRWILMILQVLIWIVWLGARRNKLLGILRLIRELLILQHQWMLLRRHSLISLCLWVPPTHHAFHAVAATLTVMPSCPTAAVVTDWRD